MANLTELANKVAALDADASPTFEFRSVFGEIEDAATTMSNGEVATLTDILNDFRGKVPRLIALKPVRAKAKDLADGLMLLTLGETIKRINDRNEALSSLTTMLQAQIAKANSDAGLLKQIKDGVEQATKTVNELKTLVNALTATDASTKTQLLAVINGIGNISNIFNPDV